MNNGEKKKIAADRHASEESEKVNKENETLCITNEINNNKVQQKQEDGNDCSGTHMVKSRMYGKKHGRNKRYDVCVCV